MADDGIEVFIRWVRRHGVTSDRARPYFTVATLLCDYERLSRLRDEAPAGLVDESLAEEFLSLADPRETVEMLTFRLGLDISPEMFKRVFERTLAASPDIEVLSGLMWVAGMYLDRHPGAFALPRNIADQLLISDDLDHRLAGLKALRHTTARTPEIVAELTRALNRDHLDERRIALTLLGQLLDDRGSEVVASSQQTALNELQNALGQVACEAPDCGTRDTAAHHSAWLSSWSDGPERI